MNKCRCCEIAVSNPRPEAFAAQSRGGRSQPHRLSVARRCLDTAKLAGSGRDPGAHAKVPYVFGSIRGSLDWSRTFVPSRSQSTVVAADPIRGRAALSGGEILIAPSRRECGYFETHGHLGSIQTKEIAL